MTTDHYPEHVKQVEELIASGEAGKKVAKEIAEDRKVCGNVIIHIRVRVCVCSYQ